MSNVRTYTAKERNMYLIGMFGQNIIYNIVSTGLYYYFQNVICLPAMALGWIFSIARVWDAINDPMMGVIVDKTHSKWGKCRPWLIFCPSIICIITCLGFANANYATAKAAGNSTTMVLIVAWAAVSYILWGMSYTVGDIPLWGIISRMSEVEKDRANLISLSRIVAAIAGGVSMVAIVPVAQAINGSEQPNGQKGFIIVGVALTIVASILFQVTGLGVKERVPMTEESKSMKDSFKLMWNCKPFRRVLISGILRAPIQLLMNIAMTLLTYYYCDGDLTNAFKQPSKLVILLIVAGGIFIGQFAAMGVCPSLIKKFGAKKVYNVASVVGVFPFAIAYIFYLIAPTSLATIPWAIADGLAFFVGGASMGAIMVCQSVMITDCIDYEEYHNGYRPDGVFFSGQSFITKFSAGISSVISAVVFAIVGYSDVNIDAMNKAIAAGANFAKDYSSYSNAMWFLITIPPAIGMLLAVIPTIKYEIDQKSHEKMLAELVERHSKMETEEN